MLQHSTDLTPIIMIAYCRPNDFLASVYSVLFNTDVPYHLYIIDNSCGKLDYTLQKIAKEETITIIRNQSNTGKGKAFRLFYPEIIKQHSASWLVSLDGDISVPPNWLPKLLHARQTILKQRSLAVLAPTLADSYQDSFAAQLQKQQFIMHNWNPKKSYQFSDNLYYNASLAGGLFLLERAFFEEIDGYQNGQIYAGDDAYVCIKAKEYNCFLGIVSDVVVLHLNQDSTRGYKDWKVRNFRGDVDKTGYWDQ